MTTRPKNWRQNERQATRERGTGRYARMAACELCDKPLGTRYYSDDRCNVTGKGLVLCSPCGTILAKMDLLHYRRAFKPVICVRCWKQRTHGITRHLKEGDPELARQLEKSVLSARIARRCIRKCKPKVFEPAPETPKHYDGERSVPPSPRED